MDTSLDNKTKRQTKYWTISGVIILILLVFASSAIEYRQSRQEYLHVLQQEGELVAGLIFRGGRMAMTGNERMERMALDQMHREATVIQQLDERFSPDFKPIVDLVNRYRHLELIIFDSSSKIIFPPMTERRKKMGRRKRLMREFLKSGDRIRPVLPEQSGFRPALPPSLLIKRKNDLGAFMLFPHIPEHMKRRRFGISSFFSELVENENIEYIIFQQDTTILAHAGVTDNALFNAQIGESGLVREINEKTVFEYSKRITRNNDANYRVRVGISATELTQLENRLLQRLLISSLVISLIAGLAWVFLLNKQRLQLVSERFKHYQSYTGNILQNMVEGVVAFDPQDKITFINTAARQIINPDSQNLPENADELRQLFSLEIRQLLEKREIIRDVEFEFLSNYQKRRLNLTTSAIFGQDGKADTFIILLRDISQLAELQAHMQRKEKLNAMGQLASGVAHEIRNPLNAIGVIIQRLNREFEPKNDGKEYQQLTKSMRQEVSRVNEIIESFLRFARPPRMQTHPTDLSILTEEVGLLYSASMQASELQIKKQLENELFAELDANQFKQALINLVRNAVDAAPANSTIEIISGQTDEYVFVHIADEGKGISNENQSKIFDLYYSTKDEGSGLGLSIVQQIVSAHDGRIELESPRPDTGNGCRFTIFLPKLQTTEKE